MSPVMPGASASVQGRFVRRNPVVHQPSYLKDTADDGLDAYLWLRITVDGQTQEKVVKRVSGLGATASVSSFTWGEADAFYLRVCVGEGTANCSAWSD
ncbi:hypothetical protein ACSHWB_42405 [Lentzea sp. HUAS TT2]|uniref:hypothetical protein n=1 Tax=Lentzea sp. HUAS TT2 TaxID=3447454 RepID=UPI003F6E47F8